MASIFISHSSHNDEWAIALRDWLVAEGWSGPNDIFLDLDPERGIAAGQKWQSAFADAATRCEAVLFLVSKAWLDSRWCHDEYQLANKYNKKLFALVVDDSPLERLPGGLTSQWQVVRLLGEPAERFIAVHPQTQKQWPVHIAKSGLAQLKSGLQKAGIGPENFDLQRDVNGPFGWRSPYPGLEAMGPEDAAVFFGRNADIIRGMDMLRGLAARAPPRVAVILGASGAGKSSFLRAGLWPRLLRDDAQWLPLKVIRAGRGGAIEGEEGLLAGLQDIHQRFALRTSRSQLREQLRTSEGFIELLQALRRQAATRALLSEAQPPLPVICLDQGEEFFNSAAAEESERFLLLVRAASEADAALILATIRSDSYSRMQNAKAFAGIDQVTLSLGPVPHGELASIIRGPAEIRRGKVGPEAPVFDAALVERLQADIEGEPDALPLLAFVLQRLMREHAGESVIGLAHIDRSGGLKEAIELEATAAFKDAGYANSEGDRREALRKLFVPPLVRINRDNKAAQRHVASQAELAAELLPLARALTERRLLVVRATKSASAKSDEVIGTETAVDGSSGSTIEVSHEALLRHWTMLSEILGQDREALLLLDSVLIAAAEWAKAEPSRKRDFLIHRGSRLTDAQALGSRAPSWAREIEPAQAYLSECQARDKAEIRAKRRMRVLVGALSGLVAAVLLAAANVEKMRAASYWFFDVRPYVKSAGDEQALLGDREAFRECRDCPDMIFIPKGVFQRGGPLRGSPDQDRETPLTKVSIGRNFAVSVTEINFSQWDVCAAQGACRPGVASGSWGRGDQPVIHVNWSDAQDYVKWISGLTGKRYRLLSEAEWEYAARGGQPKTTSYSFLDAEIDEYGWYKMNSGNAPHPTGSLKPNQYGLKDMNGNVAEWVEDCFHRNYTGAPLTEAPWTASTACASRVVRGGNWLSDAKALRSASRDRRLATDDSSDLIGFRIAREFGAEENSH